MAKETLGGDLRTAIDQVTAEIFMLYIYGILASAAALSVLKIFFLHAESVVSM